MLQMDGRQNGRKNGSKFHWGDLLARIVFYWQIVLSFFSEVKILPTECHINYSEVKKIFVDILNRLSF